MDPALLECFAMLPGLLRDDHSGRVLNERDLHLDGLLGLGSDEQAEREKNGDDWLPFTLQRAFCMTVNAA
jgi:hypothetical protein